MVNVSEGRSQGVIQALAAVAGDVLLDLHSDRDHHRSVLTLAGPGLQRHLRALARRTLELVDLRAHQGVHPRLGALDVVPFAPIGGQDLGAAIDARDNFAAWAAGELGLPCFVYGPERGLPEIRRGAFSHLSPDFGPPTVQPRTGAVCVGARPVMIAYNLWLDSSDLSLARRIAGTIRGPRLRAMGLALSGNQVQVSCNLVAPDQLGPAQAYDAVAAMAPVARAELVGLLPATVLEAIPPARWGRLDLSEERTIGARLAQAAARRAWRPLATPATPSSGKPAQT